VFYNPDKIFAVQCGYILRSQVRAPLYLLKWLLQKSSPTSSLACTRFFFRFRCSLMGPPTLLRDDARLHRVIFYQSHVPPTNFTLSKFGNFKILQQSHRIQLVTWL